MQEKCRWAIWETRPFLCRDGQPVQRNDAIKDERAPEAEPELKAGRWFDLGR